MNLFGQLAGWNHNQGSYPSRFCLTIQEVKNGQHEGGRLASAGLCQTQKVSPFQDSRNCLPLDGRGRGVADGLDTGENCWIQVEFLEAHGEGLLLDCIELSHTLSPIFVVN